MMPKYGFGTLLEERRPERELVDGQLIEVAVRDADVRDLRSDVRDFDGRVRASARAAPTRSTAARSRTRASPSTANTPWPRPAVGVGAIGATVGPFFSTNAGEIVSSVRCETVCRNGKRRRRERRRDAGHLDPDQAVSGADDGLVRQAIDGAEARPEVVLLERPDRIASRVLELLRLQVEDGGLAVDLRRRKIQRVAQAGIDREAIGDLPVVLDEVLLKVCALLNLRPAAGRWRTVCT